MLSIVKTRTSGRGILKAISVSALIIPLVLSALGGARAAGPVKEAVARPPAKTTTGTPAQSHQSAHKSPVAWRDWSNDIFKIAQQEKKLVLLDLEAVWCHWCHVMDEKTYSNPEIARLMNAKYIAVKVDQDSRPDLSNKYEEYGWPATIIFNSDGKELSKRSGYIEAVEMKKLLLKLVANPNKPEEDYSTSVEYSSHDALPEAVRKDLVTRHVEGYDEKNAGWGTNHKFLDWDSLEYSLVRAREGDKDAEKRARETLAAHVKLIDPVWGGVYQYSTYGDWDHAHFEKIMQSQAENLRIYALAAMVLGNREYLERAEKIESYLRNFLQSPEGAFYTSQDADLKPGEHSKEYFLLDDKGRRAQGIPRVDKHMYARENGWAINGLVTLYMASGKDDYLKEAVRATEWVEANRALPDGGFRHDEADKGGPFLGDTLAMGRAYLSLYQATADRKWLNKAESAANFIEKHFSNKIVESMTNQSPGDMKDSSPRTAGYLTSEAKPKVVPRPDPLLEENQKLVQFANLLFHYTGQEKYQAMAKQSMRYLSSPAILDKRQILVAGTLLADHDLTHTPAHITVVGSKQDPEARALYMAAIRSPRVYRRIDWLDKKEGTLPNLDVDFPDLPKPAAFVCLGNRCSSPAYQPEQVIHLLDKTSR